MRCFFDARQLEHEPVREFFGGGWAPHAEQPGRASGVADRLGGVDAPADHGLVAIERVHDAGYLAFLADIHLRWRAEGRDGDAIGYAWPVRGRRSGPLTRVDALLGRYGYDSCTPIGAGTWQAAYWAAQGALSAMQAVCAGERAAFALCRPPGHHAGRESFGGYCYLNNAAIAAQAALDAGAGRVAILDVDYHHGNGTQEIFWERGDVFVASIHADPATDYPYFWGGPDERGGGAGEGANLNLPLPRGTGAAAYQRALALALAAIARFEAELLVISFGADTFRGDPISHFAIDTADYAPIAEAIARSELPAAIILEGGYDGPALGENVAAFLSGFDSSDPA